MRTDAGEALLYAGVTGSVENEATPRSSGFHLTSLLSIVLTTGFAALVVGLTGDLIAFWPLYLIPIVIAAVTYYVAGAVLTSAIALLLIVLTAPSGALASLSRIGVGLAAAVLCGVVIGAQSRRHALHELELERASIYDPLTGVFKSAYLHSRLAEEMRLCDRYGVPMGLLLVEVADYAGFKQKFGHYKAELLLEHMASVIKVSLRDTDIVGRLGAEQFAVLLPFATAAECHSVAARLEADIRATQFEGDALEPVTTCDVVVACAAYPSEARDLPLLLELAGERLDAARKARVARQGPPAMTASQESQALP
ncbi:MAG: GGDEF domain-containing protein [Coriobacteriales bacterium]|nr:GGDEF domain-containing protein [Actinomycetes bacterium]